MGWFWSYSIPYNPYTYISAKLKVRMIFLKFWATLMGAMINFCQISFAIQEKVVTENEKKKVKIAVH